MAWTQADIDALKAAITAGRGAKSIAFGDQTITFHSVDEMLKSTNPEIRRLLGKEGDFGQGIGVDNDWAYQAIKQVGNYGEIFERNLGSGSRLNIARGLNRLWKDGGLQYAPPIR